MRKTEEEEEKEEGGGGEKGNSQNGPKFAQLGQQEEPLLRSVPHQFLRATFALIFFVKEFGDSRTVISIMRQRVAAAALAMQQCRPAMAAAAREEIKATTTTTKREEVFPGHSQRRGGKENSFFSLLRSESHFPQNKDTKDIFWQGTTETKRPGVP